jgi:hypothetical protein
MVKITFIMEKYIPQSAKIRFPPQRLIRINSSSMSSVVVITLAFAE